MKPMNIDDILKDLTERAGSAVAHYWKTRAGQRDKQRLGGTADQGLRSAVTGGAQMNGFIDLFTEFIVAVGIPEQCVFRKRAVELPGFFRPTKEWDLLVVRRKSAPHSAITSTTELKKPWEVLLICGRPTESERILIVPSLFSVISSCWRIAMPPIGP